MKTIQNSQILASLSWNTSAFIYCHQFTSYKLLELMKPNFCTPLPDQRTWHHIVFLQEVILTSTSEKRMYLMNNSEESQGRGHSCPICTINLFRYVKHRSARRTKASIMSPFSPAIANKTTINYWCLKMDYFSAWQGAKWWSQCTAIESGPYRRGGPQGFFH